MQSYEPTRTHVAGDDRRRLDLGSGLKRPQPAAVGDVDGVEQAAEIADVHDAVADRGRRLANQVAGRVLPAQLARREVEREQIAVAAADVDDAVGDGGGGVDHVPDVVGPQHFQRRGGRAGRDAGQARRAAELPPVVGGRAPAGAAPLRAPTEPAPARAASMIQLLTARIA